MYKRQPLLEHSDEELVGMLMVNFVAPIALTRRLLPLMRRGSTVVNVVTGGIHVLMAGLPAYGASKIALHYATEAMRRELRERGVRLVAVYPGYVATAFHERAGSAPARFARPVPPERVARAILDAVERGRERVYVPGYVALLRVLGPHLPPVG